MSHSEMTPFCISCQCPYDFEWLPCTKKRCMQSTRKWRLMPPLQQMILSSKVHTGSKVRTASSHPLPESDSEEDYIPLPSSEDEAYVPSVIHLYPSIHSNVSWSEYRKYICHLSKIPYILGEAEAILDAFKITDYKPIHIDRIIGLICAMKKAQASSIFSRNLEVSVRWHITNMEKIGMLYMV